MQEKDNKYLVPLSIVVAGVLVAGAVFWTNRDTEPSVQAKTNEQVGLEQIAVTPISESDHILGNPGAKIILVEYSDTDCPFCQRFHYTMKQAMGEYGKDGRLAWVYRHYPIPQLHPEAPREAQALECAAELGGNAKFWEFANVLYEQQGSQGDPKHPEMFQIASNIGLNPTDFVSCLDSGKTKAVVDAQTQNGIESGGQGTPHNVLVLQNKMSDSAKQYVQNIISQYPDVFAVSEDGKRVRIGGAIPYEMLKPLLEALLVG